MAQGRRIQKPVPRTRTGCLTCRKKKVKCDEAKPKCSRCLRLQRSCAWSDELQVIPDRPQWHNASPSGQSFIVELPNADRTMIPYLRHFVTFCCRFLVYSNDSDGNPFQEALVPLGTSSPALLHSMAAVAAGHLARNEGQHQPIAQNYYATALRELRAALSDPIIARLDSTLGACLMLCVFEISHSENSRWLEHLQGARGLILFRGGPKTPDYLTRLFSLLDVSGSLTAGGGPLIKEDYWLEDDVFDEYGNKRNAIPNWPAYDPNGVMINHFHSLMTFMAQLSRLSSESMTKISKFRRIKSQAEQIGSELAEWWQSCPPVLRDQRNDWRRQARPRKLTILETLEEEAFSSTKSCMYGCVIYLNHILDPLGREPQKPEVTKAIKEILENAQEVPEGYGLEMGHYWGLFMAGISVFNDDEKEALLRRKLRLDPQTSIYHTDHALKLLEILWGRQHQYQCKYDWREVQIQMGVEVIGRSDDEAILAPPRSSAFPS